MSSSSNRPDARGAGTAASNGGRAALRAAIAAALCAACLSAGATPGAGSGISDARPGIPASTGAGTAVAAPGDTGRAADPAACAGVLDHVMRPLAGRESAPLCERYAGRVLLIVNTASKCGFTPQFEDLETLYERYEAKGLSILGFPSDDFRQELADEGDVAEFCKLNYGVTFPMFQKVGVRGPGAHPLFAELAATGAGAPDWNFNKYLVDRDGHVLGRYGSSAQPLGDALERDIEGLL